MFVASRECAANTGFIRGASATACPPADKRLRNRTVAIESTQPFYRMSAPPRPQLVRAVGLFSLTAIAINGMVGSGIFVLPAQVAKILGPAGLSAYLVAGLAASLIVLCFAEVGALFDRS